MHPIGLSIQSTLSYQQGHANENTYPILTVGIFNLKYKKVLPLVPLGIDGILGTEAMFFPRGVLTYIWQYLYLGFAGPFPIKKRKKISFIAVFFISMNTKSIHKTELIYKL